MYSNSAKIILASSSRYRGAQLETLKIPYEQTKPNFTEVANPGEAAEELALRLAKGKAESVIQTHKGLIIGCDQTAEINGQILGKPGTIPKAKSQLLASSGKTAVFYSAICMINTGTNRVQIDAIKTEVVFRSLTEGQIDSYINKDLPLDCAGSFKSESIGVALFSEIKSKDPSALVGLPLIRLTEFLYEEGVDVLTYE